jgi:CheY-like chemotaxis protein
MTLPASEPNQLEQVIALLTGLASTCGDRVWQREFLDLAAACSSFAKSRRGSEIDRIKARAQRLSSAAGLVGRPDWAQAVEAVLPALDAPPPAPKTEAAGPTSPAASPSDRATAPGSPPAAQRSAPAVTEPLVARATSASQPLVLIVDSDPESRRVLETYFSAAGFRVAALEDGGPALAKIREERPALVVADLLLPMVPGEVLILALRRSPTTASIPIMVVTAEPWRLGPEHEIDVVLTKPVNVTVVVEAAKRLLGATVGTDPLQVSRA